MDKNQQIVLNVESVDYDDNNLTPKKIWAFVKANFIRAVLFMAVGAILATFVVLIFNQVRNTVSTRTVSSIEFIYDEASQGLLPNGSPGLNSNMILSHNIVDNAIASLKMGDDAPSGFDVRNAIVINDVLSPARQTLVNRAASGDSAALAQLANPEDNYFPTRFTITLRDPGALGLNNEQAKTLVNAIMREFSADFVTHLVRSQPLSYTDFIPNITSSNGYLTHITRFNNSLTSYVSTLNQLSQHNPDFRATTEYLTSVSFRDLANRANLIIEGQLNTARVYVLTHGVSSDVVTELMLLNNREAELMRDRAHYRNEFELIQDLLDDTELFDVTIIVDENGNERIITSPTATYLQLVGQMNNFNSRIAALEREMAEIAAMRTLFISASENPTEAAARRQSADNLLAELSTSAIVLVQDINAVLAAFRSQYVYSSFVRVVHEAVLVEVASEPMGTTTIVLIYGAFVVLGLVMALIFNQIQKYNKKQKELIAKAASSESSSSEVATDEVATSDEQPIE